MNDIRTALDRLRGSIVLDVDQEQAFERLRRRKDQRGTRRRLAAAATAIVIAVASTGVLIRAFDQPGSVASNPPTLPAVEPHEITTIPVGPQGQVSAITSGLGSVWVAVYGVPGGQGIDRDAILRLDPATNEVTETIPVETVPTWETGGGGLTTGFGSLWVAGLRTVNGHDRGLLLRIDPQTSAVVATIALSAFDGASDVAVNDTAVWVVGRSGEGSGITKIDPETNKVIGETPLRAQTARHVVATDTAVVVEELEWAHNAGPCSVLASVDPADAHLMAEEPARGVCSGGGSPFAWDGDVWAAGADGFAKVDPATATLIPPATPYTHGGFPRGDAAVGASGVWFGAYPGGNGEARDTLSRFDPWGGRTDTYPLKVGWSAASVLGDTIWAMNWEGTVTRIDITSGPASASGPASSNYLLTALQVGRSTDPRFPGNADVTFTQRWSSDVFPGEHRCNLTVLDGSGLQIGTLDFQMMNLTFPHRSSMPVAVDGSIEGASATGSCDPTRLDAPLAYQTSVTGFSQTDRGIEVEYRVTQPPVVDPWQEISHQACTVAAWNDGGVLATAHFTLGAPDGLYRTGIDMDPGAVPRVTTATVTCEPFAREGAFPDPSP